MVDNPAARVKPAGVDELQWRAALQRAGGPDNPDHLWPVLAQGFKDLLARWGTGTLGWLRGAVVCCGCGMQSCCGDTGHAWLYFSEASRAGACPPLEQQAVVCHVSSWLVLHCRH